MARITLAEAQAWVEATKFTITSISNPPNSDMLPQIEEEVIAQVGSVYDTSGWINDTTTPRLIRVAIAKLFVAWAYRREYSESISDVDAQYAFQLESNAMLIIRGIVDGSIEIPGLSGSATNSPGFYPNDSSSAMSPTTDDPSLGPAAFSMGTVF